MSAFVNLLHPYYGSWGLVVLVVWVVCYELHKVELTVAIWTCRPAVLSSQSWPLQAQPHLLTVAQPTTSSSVSVQLSRSQESLMPSTVPRPLTFSQQIRPQQPQLAVVTQKPMLSSVTRHAGQYIWSFLSTESRQCIVSEHIIDLLLCYASDP